MRTIVKKKKSKARGVAFSFRQRQQLLYNSVQRPINNSRPVYFVVGRNSLQGCAKSPNSILAARRIRSLRDTACPPPSPDRPSHRSFRGGGETVSVGSLSSRPSRKRSRKHFLAPSNPRGSTIYDVISIPALRNNSHLDVITQDEQSLIPKFVESVVSPSRSDRVLSPPPPAPSFASD